MTHYRNRETGIVQWHPVSGLGDDFNSDEIGTDGSPVKPFVSLPVTPEKIKAASALASDKSTPDKATTEKVVDALKPTPNVKD